MKKSVKDSHKQKAVIISLLALVFVVLAFVVHYSFLLPAVVALYLGRKELFE